MKIALERINAFALIAGAPNRADVDPGAVGAVDDTVQGQRDGGPLVLAHAAVVVGAQVADAGLFKHGHGAQVEARGVDVGNVQVEALLEVLRADGRGQHALFRG